MNTLTKKTTQNDTITIDAIIDFALKNGKRFDAYSEFTNRWGDREMEISHVGIMLRDGVWYWWKSHNFNGEGNLYFDHRYSQNTGATIKSFRQGHRAECKILNKKSFL